jgi:hypothetical protein
VTPKLVSLSCDELARGETPIDPENCLLRVLAVIGPDGVSGDNFQFYVATPKALLHSQYNGWGKDHMILQQFSWDLVENFVHNLLPHVRGDTWEHVARQLHEFMDWEFYNYQQAS